jgi:hypothetical protein
VKSTKIVYSAKGRNRSAKIQRIAEAEIDAIARQDGSEVQIHGHPLAVSPDQIATVAKSKRFLFYTTSVSMLIFLAVPGYTRAL